MCLRLLKGKAKKSIAFALALLMAGLITTPAFAETTKGFVGKEVKITHESKERYVANATFYDYYSDSQVGTGSTPQPITDALKSATYNGYKAVNTFTKFNNQLLKSMNYGDASKSPTTTPLYQGYFVDDMSKEDTGNIYGDWSWWTNIKSNFDMSAHGGYTKLFIKEGLVDSTLKTDEAGNTYITTSNPNNGQSAKLPYFDKDFLTSTTFEGSELTLGSVKEKVSFPFRKEVKNGVTTYKFDSSEDVVRFNADGKLEYKGTKDSEKVKDAKGNAGFFPYNSPADSESERLNFGFGVKVEIPFCTTEDGKINGQDIKFEFSGDDDVWVFIDGELALDMGGSHNVVDGNINFADKKANGKGLFSKKLSDAVISKLNDTTKVHTLTLYYMERGEWQSNMKLTFNLPEPNNFTVVNQVSSCKVNKTFLEEAKKVSAADRFVVGLTDKNLNEYDEQALDNKEYVSYTNEFKYNDIMQLKINGLKDTTRVLNDLYNTKYTLSDSKETIKTDNSVVVVDDENAKTESFVFRNKSNTSTPFLLASFENQIATGTLKIANKINGATNKKDTFEYTLVYSNVFGGASEAAYYQGEYTVVGEKGKTETKTAVDGKIVLKANETAEINGIPTTTKVAVQQSKLGNVYTLDKINVSDNFQIDSKEAIAVGNINKTNNEITFAIDSANEDEYDKSPKTGDSSAMAFWMINAIAAIGVLGITGIIIYRRKTEK